jgi:GrpB-like predicted nucleotidyltransferase (UPF0157 family)
VPNPDLGGFRGNSCHGTHPDRGRRRAASVEGVTRHSDADPDGVEWVGEDPVRSTIEIVDPDPAWPAHYAELAARVRRALGAAALALEHVGSTSVPDLPAKPVIDIDLTVADPRDEGAYVPALEREGFRLRLREPGWHEHRLLVTTSPPPANLHVFGADSPELVRHRMFRDWLRDHPDDRAQYAAIKRSSATASNAAAEAAVDYNRRKEPVIRDILDRMFRANGLL